MQRLISFDIAKAICIILVVIGHYVPDGSPSWYMDVHDVIYSFHMPLFMFASGFIYMATKKKIPYKDFLMKKVDGSLLLCFDYHYYYQVGYGRECLCGESCHGNVLPQNVLSSRGRILPLVYLGFVVDVCACAFVQN